MVDRDEEVRVNKSSGSTKERQHDIWTLIAVLGHSKHEHHWDTRAEEIRTMLESGSDPNAGREAPLAMAAQMGHLPIAKVLLEHGADVDGGCKYHTPLVLAADDSEMRALLLEHGATETIFSAVAWGEFDKARAYLRQDPSLLHLNDEKDSTPLLFACRRLDLPLMKLFLDAGADPNVVAHGCYGISPIHEVCRGQGARSRCAIELLAEYQADLNARNKGGVTALHMAVRDRNLEAVRALLSNGADPDIEDRGRKSTPLRRAVANTGRGGTGGQTDTAIEIVRLLLECGADPEHVNRSGKRMTESTRNAATRGLLEDAIDAGRGATRLERK